MEKKSLLTIKNALRGLALLLIIFVFCPSFLISCSGQNISVSAVNAAFGIKRSGEQLSDPHFAMMIAVLIPFVIMGLLFVKTLKEKVCGIAIEICTVIDFILQIVFYSQTKKVAESNYCVFKVKAWYVFNIIVLILVALISLTIALKKRKMEDELKSIFAGTKSEGTINQIANVAGQAFKGVASAVSASVESAQNNSKKAQDRIGFCQKCGSAIQYGCSFCTSCGTAVPKDLLEQAEKMRKAEAEKAQIEGNAEEKSDSENNE